MKLLMVVPKYRISNTPNYDYLFPLGLAYITSFLKKNDFPVDVINLNHFGDHEAALIKKLDQGYDVVFQGTWL